jgi:hypothetical protein
VQLGGMMIARRTHRFGFTGACVGNQMYLKVGNGKTAVLDGSFAGRKAKMVPVIGDQRPCEFCCKTVQVLHLGTVRLMIAIAANRPTLQFHGAIV